jgi:hypothetical protein
MHGCQLMEQQQFSSLKINCRQYRHRGGSGDHLVPRIHLLECCPTEGASRIYEMDA